MTHCQPQSTFSKAPSSTQSNSYLLKEEVSFVQHFLPGLDAGEYQLTVSQDVAQSDQTAINGASYSEEYYFAVKGDRFSISNPSQLIQSVFPANNASGEFSAVFPHVVFTQTTFPWIRYPNNTLPYVPPATGSDVEANVPTWLWVMLLDSDDVSALATQNVTLSLSPTPCTIADLFPPGVVASSTLGSNYSYFNNATDTSGLEPGESLADNIQTLDIPLSFFWTIAPTLDDLELMAHGRIVTMPQQQSQTLLTSQEQPTGHFSIVFGNRLPNTNKKTYAFLVSLEELKDFLPSDGGKDSKQKALNPAQSLRLAVLQSWQFFSTGEPATFVHKLEQLNGKQTQGTTLTIPYAGTNGVVQAALSMGYAPLNEELRTGGQTVSWYRGPLTPYSVQSSALTLPISSPDAVTAFDPTTGMLDVSYASAWTLGRLLALQDTSFSTQLYQWKKGLTQQVVNAAEQAFLDQEVQSSLQEIEGPTDVMSSFYRAIFNRMVSDSQEKK